MNYEDFLKSKEIKFQSSGFEVDREDLNENLFKYQKDIIQWSLRKGKSAAFTECGTGKTLMQLEWGNKVHEYTGKDILILAPLAVSKQTKNEGRKFGIDVNIAASQSEIKPGINITNYEKLHKFDMSKFVGIVLDESSILKSFSGKIRTEIIENCRNIQYKLACTATPAPNDFMELGNHAEFLGVMTRQEMLSMFFVHDGGNTSQWRLKGHAQNKFWEWVSTWATVMRNPGDLGYDDEKFILPELKIHEITVKNEEEFDTLIPMVAQTLQERRASRKSSLNNRVARAAELANNSNESWLVWCNYNDESKALKKAVNDGVEVTGSDTDEHKTNSMLDFAAGNIKVLISKSTICGFGMNFQSCHNMIFCGLSDSYEQFYQAVRRCWRFGQDKEVNVYIITGAKEIAVINNIKRKHKEAQTMQNEMIKYTKDIMKQNIKSTYKEVTGYNPKVEMILPEWVGGMAI